MKMIISTFHLGEDSFSSWRYNEKTRAELSREQIRELGYVGLRHLEGLVLGELYGDKKRKLVKQEHTLSKDLRN